MRVYYCEDNGRPGVPIRLIVGIIMLRRMFNQSDESVLERWVENPYWQYFCEEVYFFHDYPFDHAELIKFRRRIGEKGAEQILKATVNLFEKEEVQEKEVLKDTTVQEKNIKEQVLHATTKSVITFIGMVTERIINTKVPVIPQLQVHLTGFIHLDYIGAKRVMSFISTEKSRGGLTDPYQALNSSFCFHLNVTDPGTATATNRQKF